MRNLREFPKEFKVYCVTQTSNDQGMFGAIVTAKDGETWEVLMEEHVKPALKDPVIFVHKEIARCVLNILPTPPKGYEIVSRVTSPKKSILDQLFPPKVEKSLREQLVSALDQEDYLRAAVLRDKLKKEQKG